MSAAAFRGPVNRRTEHLELVALESAAMHPSAVAPMRHLHLKPYSPSPCDVTLRSLTYPERYKDVNIPDGAPQRVRTKIDSQALSRDTRAVHAPVGC